jgi:hypothetical protein
MVVTNPVGLMMRDHLPKNDDFNAGVTADYQGQGLTLAWQINSNMSKPALKNLIS